MLHKHEIDDVRISMILIGDDSISTQCKRNNIRKIAQTLRLDKLDEKGVYEKYFIKEAEVRVHRHGEKSWRIFLRQVLVFLEEYELIIQLRLQKI